MGLFGERMQKKLIEEMLNNIKNFSTGHLQGCSSWVNLACDCPFGISREALYMLSKQPTEWHERFKESSIKMHIQSAFKEAANCAFYDKMDNRSFLYGVLIASGLSGSMALQFIETTTFIEKDQ